MVLNSRSLNSYLLLFLLLLALDQISKIYIKLHFLPGEEVPLIDDLLKIHFIENPGAAFGLSLKPLVETIGRLGNPSFHVNETTSQLLLTAISLLILTFLIWLFWKSRHQKIAFLYLLILTGAIGNLIDRIFYGILFKDINQYEGDWFQGRVVDMIYLDIWKGYLPKWIPIIGGNYYALWPIFNLADTYISIAVILLLLSPKKWFENPSLPSSPPPKKH